MTEKVKTFRDLIVWQKAMTLVEVIYQLTSLFPSNETFGLVSQLRRSAVSIPSNIAEGWSRRTTRDYAHFLRMAYGSSSEVETQIEIASRLNFAQKEGYNKAVGLLQEVSKMLNVMVRRLPQDLASR